MAGTGHPRGYAANFRPRTLQTYLSKRPNFCWVSFTQALLALRSFSVHHTSHNYLYYLLGLRFIPRLKFFCARCPYQIFLLTKFRGMLIVNPSAASQGYNGLHPRQPRYAAARINKADTRRTQGRVKDGSGFSVAHLWVDPVWRCPLCRKQSRVCHLSILKSKLLSLSVPY